MEDVGLLMEKSLETTGIVLAELLNFVMMPQYILVTHMLHAMTGVLECCPWVLLIFFLYKIDFEIQSTVFLAQVLPLSII